MWLALLLILDDWPCWRGPNRDGISCEKGWRDAWSADAPPPIRWKTSVGIGYSAVSVSDGHLYTMGNQEDKDTVWCLDAATGAKIWAYRYPQELGAQNFEGGPTSTPTVHDRRIYTISRRGDVHCLDSATGQVIWTIGLNKDLGRQVPTWGYSGSARIHESLVLINAGSSGVALERATGKPVWASDDAEAGYSTPLTFPRDGEWHAVFSTGDSYVAANLKTGAELWRIPWVTRYGVNAADPIFVDGDKVFLSSGYGKGAALVSTRDRNLIWENTRMRNHFNSCVLIEGFAYGIDGNTTERAMFKCLRVKTGEERWSFAGVGNGGVSAAGGSLLVLSDRGELMVGPASGESFSPTGRLKVIDATCWTVPVLSNGRIYCRSDHGDLVCVDVRK